MAGLRKLLETYGPLWVASAEPLAGDHIRVVTGMAGDGTAHGTNVSMRCRNAALRVIRLWPWTSNLEKLACRMPCPDLAALRDIIRVSTAGCPIKSVAP